MTTLIDYYKPLLMSLFEFYLYEAYPHDQRLNLQTSCIPYSAIYSFYLDFGAGESVRLNKTTMIETLKDILRLDPNTVFDGL
jgi:hypothetical protein